ncbi:MAG: ABC transporter ATP-binding protein [Clostridiales bacterium]|nr:ABC transporter ATP-binding protein [Clostridiales bacterium]
MDAILKIKNLTKEYVMGNVVAAALKSVTLDIYEKEFLVILGPSGSGKSTLLNIIGGIDSPTSGEIFFRNKSLNNSTEKELTAYRRYAVGFIFQFYNLIPNLSAKENIDLVASISKNPIDTDILLEETGLKEISSHYPSQMSGGQQQRVAIARSLVKNPEILLCDEPTGALDIKTGIQILKLLKKFNDEYEKTVVIITHNASIALIANRILYIKDGGIDRIEVNKNPIEADDVVW